MARIQNQSIYPVDNNISLLDFLIGSDYNDSRKTKTYPLGNVLSLFNSESGLGIYDYEFSILDDYYMSKEGIFRTESHETNPLLVTQFKFNIKDAYLKNIESILTVLESNKTNVILKLADTSSNGALATFEITGITINPTYILLDVTAFETLSTLTFTNKSKYTLSYYIYNTSAISSEVNDLSSSVVWVNVPDTYITESSVIQHESALTITESQISDLSHFTPTDLFTDYGVTIPNVDDTVYGVSWDGNLDAPSKNAIYDKIESLVLGGGGDMSASTYDPTNVSSDAFDMDNMIEGSSNKILTLAERTILSNTSGTNTGDQDLSGLQPKPFEGQFVDGDKTKLDSIETGATADQTAGEIKTLYESNADTNAFTDALLAKLNDLKTQAITGTRVTASVSGTYAINLNNGDVFVLTMTADTTFSFSNLPTGINTKTFEVLLTGAFTPTFPAYAVATPSSDTYDGAVRNRYIFDVINGTASSEDIITTIENLAS